MTDTERALHNRRGRKGFQPVPIAARFWPKVFVPRIGMLDGKLHLGAAVAQEKDTCWEWRGSRRSRYGMVWYEGRNEPAQKVAWMLYHERSFPAGKDACHSCDNPACVNPLHVWPGSIKANALDSRRKGRHHQASKTHCRNGHPYNKANTATRPNGWRVCRICRREAWRKHESRAGRAV